MELMKHGLSAKIRTTVFGLSLLDLEVMSVMGIHFKNLHICSWGPFQVEQAIDSQNSREQKSQVEENPQF